MQGFKHKVEEKGLQWTPPPDPDGGPRVRRRNDEDTDDIMSSKEEVAPVKPASMRPPSSKDTKGSLNSFSE